MDYFDKRDDLDINTGKSNCNSDFMFKISDNFIGSTVLITGGSGFLGKLLVEKLLRSCFDLKQIFLLIRPMKNKSCDDRLDSILKEKIFENLVAEKGLENLKSKILVVPADCYKENLDLKEDIVKIIKDEVNYVLHCAAALRMDEFITTSIYTNVRSTQYLTHLADSMKNLKAFVLVSTAYSHATRKNIKEVFYDSDLSIKTYLYLADKMTDNQLAALTPKILGDNANTYSFSKAMSEDVVKSYFGKLPIAIVRPSIVVGCAKEPLVGWAGNLNGPVGILLASTIGLLHVWWCDSSIRADLIPADIVVNVTLAAAAKISTLKEKKMLDRLPNPVFNAVSNIKAPCHWGDVISLCEKVSFSDDIYMSDLVGPYSLQLQKSKSLFYMQTWLLHIIPGIIYDLVLELTNRKPKLIYYYKKILKLNLNLSYYCSNEWDFEKSNVDSLWKELDANEKNEFPFDLSGFSWEGHFRNALRALRVYLLKDPMSTIHQARIKFKRFQRIYLIFKCIAASLLIAFSFKCSNIISYFKN